MARRSLREEISDKIIGSNANNETVTDQMNLFSDETQQDTAAKTNNKQTDQKITMTGHEIDRVKNRARYDKGAPTNLD